MDATTIKIPTKQIDGLPFVEQNKPKQRPSATADGFQLPKNIDIQEAIIKYYGDEECHFSMVKKLSGLKKSQAMTRIFPTALCL
jgi:hypothetical protein